MIGRPESPSAISPAAPPDRRTAGRPGALPYPAGARFVLAGLLAVCLGFAAGAGCQQQGGGGGAAPGDSPDGSPVVARVGDFAITGKMVEDKIRKVQGPSTVEGALANPDQMQIALNSVMDQMVWGAAAKAAGYADDPSIKRAVAMFEAEEMAKKYLVDTVDKEAEPTEQEIQDFYRENQEHYIRPIRVACRHIQFSSEARASQVLAQLKSGGDFQALARQFSEDTATRDLGGAMGYVTRQDGALGLGKDPLFLDPVLALSKGQLSDVIHSSTAYHLVLCEDKDGGDPLSLNDVRDDVIRRFKPRKFAEVYNQDLLELRKKYHAEIIEKNFNDFVGIKDSADRIWKLIGETTDAKGKAELARRLSFDFPRHALADDAQLLMAYTQATELKDRRAATKSLSGFKGRFSNSDLMPAARWLEAHLDDDPFPVKSFEELKQQH